MKDLTQENDQKLSGKDSPANKQPTILKMEQPTAQKYTKSVFSESQSVRIRNEIFSLYKHNSLRGKIKVKDFQGLASIEVVFYHHIQGRDVEENIRVIFGEQYPQEPPRLEIISCNLSQDYPEYTIPSFFCMNQLLTPEKWNSELLLGDILGNVMETLDCFHASEIKRIMSAKEQEEEERDSCSQMVEQKMNKDEEIPEKIVKIRRKSSNMTGCADKQLTETKNLNRHFRSKLREVLKDLVSSIEDNEEYTSVDQIFTPNRVGFEDIRRALCNKWFNAGVRRQMNSGQFLHKILRGMMGIKSKKLMIKYYHVMVSAVEEPNSFTRWKYD